jgi:dipeptidyl aminopeptidase/acylaminoacyl peptidase
MNARRALRPGDLTAVRWLSDPRISPDGARVACVETRLDPDLDGLRSRILVLDADTGAVVGSPSPDDASDIAPQWAPDGMRLLFVGGRQDARRLWLTDRDGGSPTILPGSPDGAAEPDWSPDGRRVVCSVTTAHATPASVLVEVTRDDYKRDGQPVGSGIASRAIWVVEDGQARALTAGLATDRRPAWSPDGTRVGFQSDRGREGTAALIDDVWQVDALDGGPDGTPPVRLTDGSGAVLAFCWSPDGTRLALLGHGEGNAQGRSWRLRLVEADGRRRPASELALVGDPPFALGLTPRADDGRGMGDAGLAWTSDAHGDRIWTRWADGIRGALGWVALDGRWQTVVGGDRSVLAWSLAPGVDRLAFVASDPADPGEVHVAGLDGTDERRSSHRNDGWLAEVELAPGETLRAVSPDGGVVEARLTQAHRADGDPPRPLIVSVHGGPHYSVGMRFSFETQRLAALGYAVLDPNPRGSLGYGQAHAAAVVEDWGGGDLADVLAITQLAAARADIDTRRMGITGVSYGGYMTLWAISQDPRFRAAISENGISDLFAAFGTSEDAGRWWRAEMGGAPWDAPLDYVDRSPIRFADRITTPLLLLHAELDQNVSIAQSEQMYAALRMLGRPVDFVRVPGEGHLMDLVGSARFRMARMERTREFWERTLGPEAATLGRPGG